MCGALRRTFATVHSSEGLGRLGRRRYSQKGGEDAGQVLRRKFGGLVKRRSVRITRHAVETAGSNSARCRASHPADVGCRLATGTSFDERYPKRGDGAIPLAGIILFVPVPTRINGGSLMSALTEIGYARECCTVTQPSLPYRGSRILLRLLVFS